MPVFIVLAAIGFIGMTLSVGLIVAAVGSVVIDIRDALDRIATALEAANESYEATPVVGFHVPDEPDPEPYEEES